MTQAYLPETSCAASKAGAIAIIKALQPNPAYRPDYDVHNGDTAWRFSDYCRRHGYTDGRYWTEHIMNRVPWIPEDCTLFTTFFAFLEIERDLISNTVK